MKKMLLLWALLLLPCGKTSAADARVEMDLNGTWQFEQTLNASFPSGYSRTCPVPGLVHMATPKIETHDYYFLNREQGAEYLPKGIALPTSDELSKAYPQKYSWYRKTVRIPKEMEGKKASLYITKSQFVTQVYINGMDAGRSISCYTPVECYIDPFLKYGEENEILIRVGEHQWLPREAAGSYDPEKMHYLPGIWDDVKLIFSENLRAQRVMVLPQALAGKVTIKTQLRSLYPRKEGFVGIDEDSCTLQVTLREKVSQKVVAQAQFIHYPTRGYETVYTDEMDLKEAHLWTADDPFLYEAEVCVMDKEQPADKVVKTFGMRDFEQRGKDFYLNGKRTYLRGTNITLHRFFEDPACENLPWDRAWVTKLLTEQPNELHWNAMRICVGIVPDFWYDIADSCGLMLQNEWMYFFHHGEPQQIRKEFTEWVWADACHPSIVIWDPLNECSSQFIANELIPEMRQLDPTRIWDNGYMGDGYYWGVSKKDRYAKVDYLDEPHFYTMASVPNVAGMESYLKWQPLHMGVFDNYSDFFGKTEFSFANIYRAKVPQICNEYAWMWLWRDGTPSGITQAKYEYHCGPDPTPQQCWELQAYWTQIDTEWLRVERNVDGILAFTYLTNNYDVTGDWWLDPVRDLQPNLTMEWMKHAFHPTAVFMNLQDQRYLHYGEYYEPKSTLAFKVVGVNDLETDQPGRYVINLINANGKTVKRTKGDILIPAYEKCYQPVELQLPAQEGGYLLLLEYYPKGEKTPVLSRRYIKIGKGDYPFYDYNPRNK